MLRVRQLLGVLCVLIASLWMARVMAAPPTAASPLPGVPLGDAGVSIGTAAQVQNLTLFPIYGRSDAKYDDVVSLETALAKGKAVVREKGGEPAQRRAPARARPVQQAQNVEAGGATVGELVIENKGKRPILVLAGTVVKGGNQDRQIAQDFVIARGETVPVDAFCVEQGRWSGEREGKSTRGKFASSGMLAPAKVRTAAQYEGDQGKVWKKVSEVNAKHKKRAKSGTLMATYADKDVGRRREALAKAADAALRAAVRPREIVGFAYAIDGKVRGARWFLSHKLFEEYRGTLINTAAMDALTSSSGTKRRRAAKAPKAAAVRDFVHGLRKAKVKKTAKTKSRNENRYRESDAGYSAEAIVADENGDVTVTVDVVAK